MPSFSKIFLSKLPCKYANGIVEAPPRFHELPEKRPIRKNEGTAASHTRRIELILSLEVLGYFKEKRVRNDLIL